MIIQRLITTKFGTCFGGGEVENSGEGVQYTPFLLWWVEHTVCCFMLHSPRHIIALSFVVFEEFTVRSFCLGDPGWLVTYIFLMVAHSGFFKELVFIVVVVVVVVFHFIAGAKVHTCSSLSMTPFQWSQSWAEYQPALSNYLQLSLGIYLKNVNSSALSLVP